LRYLPTDGTIPQYHACLEFECDRMCFMPKPEKNPETFNLIVVRMEVFHIMYYTCSVWKCWWTSSGIVSRM